MNLNQYTFGNSPCAINLVAILNQLKCEKTNKKITRFLIYFNSMIKQLEKIDGTFKSSYALMLRNEILRSSITVEEKVLTHAKNILIAKLRSYY